MIHYNPKNWFALIFHSFSNNIIRLLLPTVVALGIYSILLVYIIVDYFNLNFRSTTEVHSLLGIVLGLFLVFRTNSAYDRWWEGRKHWGSLVNNTRNLASKLSVMLPMDDLETRQFFAKMIPNFVVSLRDHLRNNVNIELLDMPNKDVAFAVKNAQHVPNVIVTLFYEKVNQLYKQERISGHQFFVLDKEVKSLSDILGACERIKNTPIPYSYSMYIKKFIFTFTVTLPFGFVTSFHYWTVPIVLIIYFILVSIELIAEEIEDPFGNDVNDLPTDELTAKIKSNVDEIFIFDARHAVST